jgi:HAD superfamily hydrolase (TIGR01450 family)
MPKKLAVILAAGVGSRLNLITQNIPKSLIKVSGREILDHQIYGYLKAGIKESGIFIVTGYKSFEIEKFLHKNYPNVNVIKNADFVSTNNMYSLYLALKTIENKDFDFLFISNADCLYDRELIKELAECKRDNAIATDIGNYMDENMKVTVKNGKITDISKEILVENAAGVSVDLYKYSKTAIKELFAVIKFFIEINGDLKQWTEKAFPILFQKIEVYPFDIKRKKWAEIDNMDDLLFADKLFSNFNYKSKKCYICDLDGTLFIGDSPIQKAVNFVVKNQNNFDFYYITNNTSKTPQDYISKLEKYGIKTVAENIATPLYPLIKYIRKFKSVYLVANEKVKDFIKRSLSDIRLDFDLQNNQAVILTYDNEINYEKFKNMSELLNVKENIEYLATHIDVFCPTEKGNIPDIGSFIELIYKTTLKKPSLTFGKPNINLVEAIVDKYGRDIVVVGDRLYTDKKLAENIGCDFICVLSGETSRLKAALEPNQNKMFITRYFGEELV